MGRQCHPATSPPRRSRIRERETSSDEIISLDDPKVPNWSSALSEHASRRRRMSQVRSFFRPALILAVFLLGAGIALRGLPSVAESARSIPAPVLDEPSDPQAT